MADPAYFATSAVPADLGSNATTQISVPRPGSMVEGDLVVVECIQNSPNDSVTWSVGLAAGQTWTRATPAGANPTIFWCTFNGTWDGDPRFDVNTALKSSCLMQVFNGQGTSYRWQQDVAYSRVGLEISGPHTITGITTTADKAVVLAGWSSTAFQQQHTGLSGTDWNRAGGNQYRNTASSDITLSHAYKLMPTAGATSDVISTTSGSSTGWKWIMAWKNVLVTDQEITPSLVTGDDGFFAPFASNVVSPTRITGDDGHFIPVLQATNTLSPTLVTGDDGFFTPVIAPSSTIEPTLFGGDDGFFIPEASFTLLPTLVVGDDGFFTPTFVQDLVIEPALVTGDDEFFIPIVINEGVDQIIFASPVTGDDGFFAPELLQDKIISPSIFGGDDEFFRPRFDPIPGAGARGNAAALAARRLAEQKRRDEEAYARWRAEKAQEALDHLAALYREQGIDMATLGFETAEMQAVDKARRDEEAAMLLML